MNKIIAREAIYNKYRHRQEKDFLFDVCARGGRPPFRILRFGRLSSRKGSRGPEASGGNPPAIAFTYYMYSSLLAKRTNLN